MNKFPEIDDLVYVRETAEAGQNAATSQESTESMVRRLIREELKAVRDELGVKVTLNGPPEPTAKACDASSTPELAEWAAKRVFPPKYPCWQCSPPPLNVYSFADDGSGLFMLQRKQSNGVQHWYRTMNRAELILAVATIMAGGDPEADVKPLRQTELGRDPAPNVVMTEG